MNKELLKFEHTGHETHEDFLQLIQDCDFTLESRITGLTLADYTADETFDSHQWRGYAKTLQRIHDDLECCPSVYKLKRGITASIRDAKRRADDLAIDEARESRQRDYIVVPGSLGGMYRVYG